MDIEHKDTLRLAADTLRMLAADAVEQANSGHPGFPMGGADYAIVLWQRFLRFNPGDPGWPGRDRFILSAGHGSMLLYGLLHLYGYPVSLDDIKNFRQWGSITPGHPEYGHTPGVEVTTGPLGQGFAMGVGMALAARMAGERFNAPDFQPAGQRVFGIVSDGDLMEGLSHEAASLAGHLRLGNLVYIYDDNGISIDGPTSLTYSDDVRLRFESYGWQVQTVDGHDHGQIERALQAASGGDGRPSLIIARSHIGFGSPGKQDRNSAHGAPLGKEELAATRRNLNWPDQPFHIPETVTELCRNRVAELAKCYDQWRQGFETWHSQNQERAELWDTMMEKRVPQNLAEELLKAVPPEAAATRSLSGKAIQRIAALVPALVSGSADLAHSTNTDIKDTVSVKAGSFAGRNLHFGIREHAMAAVMNGMACYGCFIPVGSTFLVFSDYCRPSIRLAALMRQQVVYVFTHDSIMVGEDGPTHQPVEQLSALRLIPGLQVIRPADAVETAMAWVVALKQKNGPTALILTRQKLPIIEREAGFDPAVILRGGYAVKSFGAEPSVVLLASGSEVGLAIEAAKVLLEDGVGSRVVSIPCLETFIEQPQEFIDAVLPRNGPRVAIEAGRGALWRQLVGTNGTVIGIETYGASAPDKVLAEKYGLTPAAVAAKIKERLC